MQPPTPHYLPYPPPPQAYPPVSQQLRQPEPWSQSRHNGRLFRQVDFPLPLLARIGSAEDKLKYSPLLSELLGKQVRKAPVAASGLDVNGKLYISGRKRPDNLITAFGYPKTDEDVDYCLEDTPGLSPSNFTTLKSSLVHSLSSVRRAASECVGEMETVLSQQIAFRVVPGAEVDRRIQYIVSRFCKARKQVLHKYRGYVRNRRWIENVATRQRRGCLSHRQNNILRLWLFSNFSNPYPDGGDKRRLISQTGLSMTQINNWLINARSRVWKPTVEIMSGERVRTEMTSKEDRCFDFKNEPRAEFDGDYFPVAAPTAHTGHALSLQDSAPGAVVAVSHNATGGTGGNLPAQGGASVEGLAEDGNWLAPQQWSGLDFAADVHLAS